MAFCPNCGANVDGKFCAKCGTAITSAGSGSATANPGGGAPYATGAAPAANYTQSNTAGMSDNVAGALCYVLGLITGIVFLVLAPYNQNKFVRFHAFQAIFFHVAFIGIWIAETIVAMMLPWSLSVIMSLVGMLVALGGLALWVWLIVKAYQGDRFKLPVVGDLAEKQA
jgi:uncharacterized membrane protein